MKISRLFQRGSAVLAPALLISLPASAHSLGPNFAQAVDLGTTTDWPAAGMRSEATHIPDVEGYGANYFRFRVAERGPVLVWTSGGFSPDLQVYDGSTMAIGSEGTSRRAVVLDPGLHYVRARSRSVGGYRLHVAGGGRGHDDIGNTRAQAAPLPSCRGLASPRPTDCRPSRSASEDRWNGQDALDVPARLDYERDRDWYKFEVPPGPSLVIRIWSIGGTDTWAALYDGTFEVELETNDDSGPGSNFFIDRALEPGSYYLGVYGRYTSTVGSYRLHLTGLDDHGNSFETGSRATLPTDPGGVAGVLDYSGDRDYFWFQVSTSANVDVWSSGGIDTVGVLYDAFEVELASNDDSGPGANFFIGRALVPGTYLVRVRGYSGATGAYSLHISGEASGVVTVPLLPADGNARGQQGFVRVTNHSEHRAEVAITAVDDIGMRSQLSSPLELAPWQTRHFNSRDLERGAPDKGIASGGVGNGTGNWYLEVAPSRPEVEVLSYIRTRDGFLTSMHTQAPSYGRTHRVAVFNPGSNRNQASRLRLINLKCPGIDPCEAANVTIYGVDDDGMRSPDVRLAMATGTARELTAAQLEGIDHADGIEGSLGNGSGKWQLFVTADRPIQVMSLLESVSGHLTNLSAPASRQAFAAPARQE